MSEATQLAVAHVLGRVAQVQCHGPKGVLMPIGREETCGNLDLAFWLQVHLQHQDGTAHSDVGLFCFWKREPSHGTALLSIGPGSPNSLRLLVNPEAQDDAGFSPVASQAIDEFQKENNQYGHMVWRHDVNANNFFSLSGYMRHTRATFKTDPLNLLAYTADPAEPFSAADQDRNAYSTGVRFD